MLTARDEEPDRVAGLELGADDYVAKPFSLAELVARMKAIRRSEQNVLDEALTPGHGRACRGAREVTVDGRQVELTVKGVRSLLACLRCIRDIVLSR